MFIHLFIYPSIEGATIPGKLCSCKADIVIFLFFDLTNTQAEKKERRNLLIQVSQLLKMDRGTHCPAFRILQ